jgi:hypothetical protein
MVRYGGFISDNEDEVAEGSAVKNTQAGIDVKKPIKGIYASIRVLRNSVAPLTLQTCRRQFRYKITLQKQ